MNGLALCAGIGGIEFGIKKIIPSYRTICYVEREIFAAANLVALMEKTQLDEAPIWDDIRTFDGTAWLGKVDLLTSGFPCQPYSGAASGRNNEEQDVWPEIANIIQQCRPKSVFLENVLIKSYIKPYKDLRNMGFEVKDPFVCSASEMGAPHRRRRIFVYAYDKSQPRLKIDAQTSWSKKNNETIWKNIPRSLGMVDGIPNRMDRLRVLGNSVMPSMATFAFKSLINEQTT